ncbi:MAG: hypothetical protein H6754_00275 [Candidatus Omnitrophica bacterium]|nr:hypothetical protein [Candidatus Omnitrophota bacterium]
MKFNQKAQQVIEYLLIMAAVVAGVLGIAGPSGPMRNAVEKSLNKAVETIYQGYTWRLGSPGPCSASCGIGTASRGVSCQREDGVNVADSFCEEASGVTRASLETVACDSGVCGSYAWVGGGFGACSVLCGGGTQTQTVICRDSGGATVADTFCASAGPKPDSQPCNTGACYVWQSGGACTTTCTVACGIGSCSQDVSCKDTVSGTTTADSNCPSGTKPSTTIPCNTSLTCGFQWQVGSWSACTVACGGGTRTRTVQCIRQSDGTAVADTNCDAGSKPSSSGTCNTVSCNHWELTSSWGPCNSVCGSGTQEIIVECKNLQGIVLADNQCDIATKPSSTRACPSLPSCGYSWGSSLWGSCSVTCGTGTQNRTVFCTRTFDGTNVDVSFCQAADPSGEPAASQPCTIGCYSWVATSWGACSTTCGIGTQSRNYECRDGNGTGPVVGDNFCIDALGAPPTTTQNCSDTSSCCGNGTCDNFPSLGYTEPCDTCSNDCGTCVTFSCTGTPVNRSEICPGADVGLTANTPYRFSPVCNGTKCQTVCSYGYYYFNSNNCRTNRCLGVSGGAQLCGNGQDTNIPTHNYRGTLAASCDGVTKCQSTCRSGYTFTGSACYIDYEWRTASCGACNAICGGGTQVCTYACYQKSTNLPVGSSECTSRGIASPPANQSCNTISCCGAGYLSNPRYGGYDLFGSGSYVASTATAYCQSIGCTGNNGYTVTTAGGPFPCEFAYVTAPLVIGNVNCAANSWCGVCVGGSFIGFQYKMNSVSCY